MRTSVTILLMGLFLSLATSSTVAGTLEQQRELFLQAESALQKKDYTQYYALLPKLQDYPLYPYLFYKDLRQRLATAKNDEFSLFFYNYGNTPLAPMLRSALLKHLAGEKRWKDYLTHYLSNGNIQEECYYRTALLKTGQQDRALEDIQTLWLFGHRRPSSCEPVFQAGRKAGIINHELVRQRAYLALEKGQTALARQLAQELSSIEKNRIKNLARLYRYPERAIKIKTLGSDKEATRRILINSVKRLARNSFEQATANWKTLQGRFNFTPEEKAEVIRGLGLRLAWQHNPEGLEWLSRVNSLYSTKAVREWRVRLALRQGDWKETLKWLDKLNDQEKSDEEWLYWRARALEATGKQKEASAIYQDLATNRSYHGFLAADRLEQPYRFGQRPLAFSEQELQIVARIPAVQRAGELYQLGRITPARREWQELLSH